MAKREDRTHASRAADGPGMTTTPTTAAGTASLLRGVAAAEARRDPSMAPPRSRVTYLGHASLLIESGGDTLVTDPVFSNRVGRIFTKRTLPSQFRPADLGGIVGVLISHAHHDHLDYPSMVSLGRTHPVVVPWGLTTAMRWHGFTDVRVARPWEELSLGRWQVTAVPSRHFGGRIPFVYTSGHQGYVLSGPSCIYFAGDTGLDEGMFREIGRRFSLDLAILPIAGAVFAWFRRNHMNAHDALRAFDALGAKRLLPMHFETFPASFEPSDAPRRALEGEVARRGWQDRVVILPEGGSLDLS
jgi:L-ascorbate metabolism protein UlaG (beta-lactamase superfamily)